MKTCVAHVQLNFSTSAWKILSNIVCSLCFYFVFDETHCSADVCNVGFSAEATLFRVFILTETSRNAHWEFGFSTQCRRFLYNC